MGNALGSRQPDEAAKLVFIGINLDFLYGLFGGFMLLYVLRSSWCSLFTKDIEARNLAYDAMPVMFLYLVVDSTKCVTLNILRSTGRPSITVWGNSISCLLIMLPLGWQLAITYDFGIVGIWFAMSVAWLIMTIVYLWIIICTDWRTQMLTLSSSSRVGETDGVGVISDSNHREKDRGYSIADRKKHHVDVENLLSSNDIDEAKDEIMNDVEMTNFNK